MENCSGMDEQEIVEKRHERKKIAANLEADFQRAMDFLILRWVRSRWAWTSYADRVEYSGWQNRLPVSRARPLHRTVLTGGN